MTDRSQRLPCCGTDNSTLQCCTTRPTGHLRNHFPNDLAGRSTEGISQAICSAVNKTPAGVA
jgi:hypothetical protein